MKNSKQTTKNNWPQKVLFGFKIFFLCLSIIGIPWAIRLLSKPKAVSPVLPTNVSNAHTNNLTEDIPPIQHQLLTKNSNSKSNIKQFFKGRLMAAYHKAPASNGEDCSSIEGFVSTQKQAESYENPNAEGIKIYQGLQAAGGSIIMNIRGDNACGMHSLVAALILNQANPKENFLSWVTADQQTMILNLPDEGKIEINVPESEINQCIEGKDILHSLLMIAQENKIEAINIQTRLNEKSQLSLKIFFKYLCLNIMNHIEKPNTFQNNEKAGMVQTLLTSGDLGEEALKKQRPFHLFHPDSEGFGLESHYFDLILQILKVDASLIFGAENVKEIKKPTIFTEDGRHYKLVLPEDHKDICAQLCAEIPELNTENEPFFTSKKLK